MPAGRLTTKNLVGSHYRLENGLGLLLIPFKPFLLYQQKKIRKTKAVSNGLWLDFPNVRVLDIVRIRRFRDFFHFGHGQCHSDVTRQMYLCVQMRSS